MDSTILIFEEILPQAIFNEINSQIKERFNEEEFLHLTDQTHPRIGNIYATRGILDNTNNFVIDHKLDSLRDIVFDRCLAYHNRIFKDNKTAAEIHSSWLTKSINRERSQKHNHSKDILVCVYYYQSNPDEGSLRVFDDNDDYVDCGHGVNSEYMANLGSIVDAVDISKFAIAYCKSNIKNVNFIEGNFFSIDLDQKYDLIFDRGFFHGLDRKSECVEKIKSLLNPPGVWLSLIGSAENLTKENKGPPAHKLTDVVSIIDPHLKITSVRLTTILNKKLYILLFGKSYQH